jgi:hypothetical protein
MEDISAAPAEAQSAPAVQPELIAPKEPEVVSTHVLVPEDQVDRLRELSRRTRVAQSEYLREAVEDLLIKYGRREAPKP